ncbi:hypothetical protein NH288_09000 [Anaerococcus sp. NML200537]|uniref:hypothetical protein n=1 Tax=Anaerococcus sp. NML200537 TaxID=2954485 RepID=UPI002238A75F|nr:hypothetical protein [Anaerococcus sp. NML200537]MCW6702219.1 hypothetical protein [Anaerococcus sp. NML200537]
MSIKEYEKIKTKKYMKNLNLFIVLVHIFSLIFFTIVGKLDNSGEDYVLQNASGLTSLATTITMSFTTIYVVYLMNKNFIIRYIGRSRERMYLYPSGRDEIFKNKLFTSISFFSKSFFLIVVLVNILFLFSSRIINISLAGGLIYNLVDIFVISILALLVSITMITSSTLFGIKLQSTNVSLITSVVLVALLGNLVAGTYNISIIYIGLICVLIILSNYLISKYLLSYIFNIDIMNDNK